MNYRLIHADVLDGLRQLPDESVQVCVTSPPYFGLRDYGIAGQLGLERTPDEYVARMVEVFREVKRVLRKDGTLWLNIGDSYAANRGYQVAQTKDAGSKRAVADFNNMPMSVPDGLKPKDLCMVPARLALGLQSGGWYLRSDIIWSKPNPMPESVTDRPTKAHEYLFLLTRSNRYYYDAAAIAEPCSGASGADGRRVVRVDSPKNRAMGLMPTRDYDHELDGGRNKRSVWTIATEPFSEAHFATFPTALVEPCILAGSRFGDTVLDPFNGSGTTGVVALSHQRNYIGIDLNADYIAMARRRLEAVAPMFATEITA